MRPTASTNYFLILFSVFIALIFTILPLSHQIIWFWPQWIFAVLLFWVITSPTQCGVGFAFIVGLCTDLATGTCMGQHAVSFVLVTYCVLKMHAPILHSPLIQQASIVAIFGVFNVLIQGFIFHLTGHATHDWLGFISVFTTFLIWPFMFVVLNKMRPRALIR